MLSRESAVHIQFLLLSMQDNLVVWASAEGVQGGSRQFGSPMSQVNYGLGLRLRVWRKLKMIPKGQDANMPETLAPPWLHMTKVARLVRLVVFKKEKRFFLF